MNHGEFVNKVQEYYKNHARDLPWRPPELPIVNGQLDPYKILLSEIMLQQTQVSRVIKKYHEFLLRFPTIESAAKARQKDILETWQGLGYNRRALYLHRALQNLSEHKRWNKELLVAQAGIGPNTAGAVMVYAYNQPHLFIETNVRAAYIHHFFADEKVVPDQKLVPHIEATLDTKNPRQWYWALMDYGTFIKKAFKNPAKKSKHYRAQSQFEGSSRQLRAQIIRELLAGSKTDEQLKKQLKDERVDHVLKGLTKEGFLERKDTGYSIAK